ncbi:hypothetical protein BLOT_007411 [Blomia tropicalis]|nr:hypothetical protein BLOT_007411 [Blomia tropicalis]
MSTHAWLCYFKCPKPQQTKDVMFEQMKLFTPYKTYCCDTLAHYNKTRYTYLSGVRSRDEMIQASTDINHMSTSRKRPLPMPTINAIDSRR